MRQEQTNQTGAEPTQVAPTKWRALVAARVIRLVMNVGGSMTQAEQVSLGVEAIGEAIEALGSVPSGHLYARLMDKLSIEEYTGMLKILKALDLVTESGNLLTWRGR